MSLGLGIELEIENDESVVCPEFWAAHSLRDLYILLVPLSDDDIVNKMQMFVSWVYPRCPVAGREAEDSVGDREVMFRTGLEE